MDWLPASLLERLRDRLQERGQRPSIAVPANLPPSTRTLIEVNARWGPLSEAMYLMMAADGRVVREEREVLKGALRVISGNTVRGVHIETMLDSAAKLLAAEGREARLNAVIEALDDDPTTAEVVYVLTAAVALADRVIAKEEQALLNELASRLRIDKNVAQKLLGELQEKAKPSD